MLVSLHEVTSVATNRKLVGGKAFALAELIQSGYKVPPGFVLTTEFFEAWRQTLQASDEWNQIANARDNIANNLCEPIQRLAEQLPFTSAQQQVLADIKAKITLTVNTPLFAVRSSSPEEDGDELSFAGQFLTRLGVRVDQLETAIRHCFVASLDHRVFTYRMQHKLSLQETAFALLIQAQIPSEISGVGFSLNPISNDYDEAVINANWGLGETVVAGDIEPDQFVIDKVSHTILGKKRGRKQHSLILYADGDIKNRLNKEEEFSLSDKQALEITKLIAQIENHYQRPMDIEWAIHDDNLYLLQARPITTYIPLDPVMQTEPGARRRLYNDVLLSKGYTANIPCSPLELSSMQELMFSVVEPLTGKNPIPDKAMIICAGNRVYLHLSPLLRLVSPRRWAKANQPTDVGLAKIIENIDRNRYKSLSRPRWLSISAMGFLLKILWRFKGLLFTQPIAHIFGAQDKFDDLLAQVKTSKHKLQHELDYSLDIRAFTEQAYGIAMSSFFGPAGSLLMGWLLAQGLASKLVGKKPDRLGKLEKLTMGFPDNVVTQMGIMMHDLAKQLQPADFNDIDGLANKIQSNNMPEAFMAQWSKFIAEFGSRGPMEMSSTSPRYGDDTNLALRQMAALVDADETSNPSSILQQQLQAREQAYEQLMLDLKGWRKRLFRRCYKVIDKCAGYRDTPKYLIVMAVYAIKQRALMEGEKFVQAGRLEKPEQIFGLSLSDIETANADPKFNLMECYQQRTKFYNQLKRQVKYFPSVIDSRGRILRPKPVQQAPGQYVGTGVSAGVAKGPIKVLETPDQKPVHKGDIIVTYTTDPGWTPLFINAAAIVLEIGGALQHGAVVAREYGKPCVVGIDQIVSQFKDGQLVEVDGDTGLVRLIN